MPVISTGGSIHPRSIYLIIPIVHSFNTYDISYVPGTMLGNRGNQFKQDPCPKIMSHEIPLKNRFLHSFSKSPCIIKRNKKKQIMWFMYSILSLSIHSKTFTEDLLCDRHCTKRQENKDTRYGGYIYTICKRWIWLRIHDWQNILFVNLKSSGNENASLSYTNGGIVTWGSLSRR